MSLPRTKTNGIEVIETSMFVPANPSMFHASSFLRPGVGVIREVGRALAAALEDHVEFNPNSGKVGFCINLEPEPADVPNQIASVTKPLTWWQMNWLLQWPREDLLEELFADGDVQLGGLVEFGNGSRAVRAKTNWETGHSIGFRSSAPNWAWNPGTVFVGLVNY